jgi:hypothetical protein
MEDYPERTRRARIANHRALRGGLCMYYLLYYGSIPKAWALLNTELENVQLSHESMYSISYPRSNVGTSISDD